MARADNDGADEATGIAAAAVANSHEETNGVEQA